MTLLPQSGFDAEGWANWFWADYLPVWLDCVQDPKGGVFDLLNAVGHPSEDTSKTVLAQARTLFTLSHLALLSSHPELTEAAGRQATYLLRFRKRPGLYRRALGRDGLPNGHAADEIACSYDQTFVILGLVTWNRLSPAPDLAAEIEACWEVVTTTLTDPATGLLRNDDAATASNPAQNPHMHLYEACLQAHEMTGEARWLTRATSLRALALRHFFDQDSGSIAEVLTADLRPLSGSDGLRREPGHQCEWAWLLDREADLGGDPELRDTARRLMAFADRHGFVQSGPLKGAAYDAVSSTGAVMDETHLLWPQTEAIKIFATHHIGGDPVSGARAKALLCLMFEGWFAGRPTFVNQLDSKGTTLWPEALTRLFYHLALALTEGARAGLWPGIARQ